MGSELGDERNNQIQLRVLKERCSCASHRHGQWISFNPLIQELKHSRMVGPFALINAAQASLSPIEIMKMKLPEAR